MEYCVSYLRYSSDNQREESIFAQRRVIEAYAEKKGLRIVREYVDEAQSAKNDDRPSFLQMIDDITSGIVQPDYVLVHKFNRFARNRYDAAIYRRKLKQSGARLIAVAQPIGDEPEGIILEAMLDAIAEYQNVDLGREVFKGLKENAIQGMTTGGKPPLGFDVDKETKKYKINESEAVIIRLIFDMVRDGTSYVKIMEECNKRGYKTKRGKAFGQNSIHDILRNEKYCGRLVFHKRDHDERNSHKFRPKEEWVVVDDVIPAIVAVEQWEEVQKIMDGRKRELTAPKAKGDNPYLLTGKLECGGCGAAYVGNSSRAGGPGKKETYYYYTCSGNKRLRNCSNKDIRKDYLENFVLDRLGEIFSNENMEEWTENIEKIYAVKLKEKDKTHEQMKARLEKIEKQINRFLDSFAEGTIPADIAGPKLTSLNQEKKDIEIQMALNKRYVPLTKKQIRSFMVETKKQIENRNNPQECRKIINTYIDKVLIYPDNVKVVYKFDFGYHGTPEGCLTISETYSRKEIYGKK